MKTILGKKVKSYHFYKLAFWNTGKRIDKTCGYVYLEDGTTIKICGSKFTIIRSNTQTGVILKTAKAYKQIKRMIGRDYQLYRKHGSFNNGFDYWRAKVQMSINRIKTFKNKLNLKVS